MNNKITLDKTKIAGIYTAQEAAKVLIPLLEGKVSAGFPSSAENYIDKALDLNELLIGHPAATFFIRVRGNSMINAGIRSNDILIVDRARAVTSNKVVIARLGDELTVKRIKLVGKKLYLIPENDEYDPIEVSEDMDFEVWGVVTYVIHQV